MEKGGLSATQYWILVIFSLLVLAVHVANLVIVFGNRERQVEVIERTQLLQQATAQENLYRSLLRGVVELAVRNDDSQLRKLAENHGVAFNAPGPNSQGKK